jgi:hypothetical protein
MNERNEKGMKMESPVDWTNAAMIKKALRNLTYEQLTYALDTGVRLLDAWHIPVHIKMPSSEHSPHTVYVPQVWSNSVSLNRPIRINRKRLLQN